MLLIVALWRDFNQPASSQR